jgi:hypothetical protein
MKNVAPSISRYAPSRNRRVLRPSDWGYGVTICIASLAESGRNIVVATDQKAAMESASADHVMVKGDFIGLQWFAMWSADDIGPIPSILRRTEDDLKANNAKPFRWTARQVATALSRAYQHETRERAVNEFLSPFGLDMPEFLSNGSHIFQDTYIARLQDIQRFDLGINFLVAGYHDLTASIFTVGRRGHVNYFNKPGFWAIGSGESLAFGALVLRGHNIDRTTEETLYAVLEAKFCAESARDVGKHTTAGVLDPHALIQVMPAERIDLVRDLWERQGRPPVPPEALLGIQQWWRERTDAIDRANAENTRAFMQQQRSQATKPIPPRSKRGRKVRPPSQG